MTTGIWVFLGFIGLGLATSLLLLPKRVTQVVRTEAAEIGAIETKHSAPAPTAATIVDMA